MTMPAMLTELYDALRRANVPEEQARAAAEAVMATRAEGFSHLAGDIAIQIREAEMRIGAGLSHIETTLTERLAKVETTITHMWWLLGAVFLMQLGALYKAFWG